MMHVNKTESKAPIHLIPKWRPINYSSVCMFISPLCLIFTAKFFFVFYMLTRHQGLINMQTRIIHWRPFWNKVYVENFPLLTAPVCHGRRVLRVAKENNHRWMVQSNFCYEPTECKSNPNVICGIGDRA